MISERKIPLAVYVAANNQQAAINLLHSYGYGISDNSPTEEVIRELRQFVVDNGERALVELSRIHPDRSLVLETKTYINSDGNTGTCSGCGGACACGSGKSSNAAGATSGASTPQPPGTVHLPIVNTDVTTTQLIIGTLALIAMIAILKK